MAVLIIGKVVLVVKPARYKHFGYLALYSGNQGEGKGNMTAQERQVIEKKIAEIKNERQRVRGSPCEVYSRVVGYLYPAISCFYVKRHWNYSVCTGGKTAYKFYTFSIKKIL